MKKGINYYLNILIIVFLNTTLSYAQDFNISDPYIFTDSSNNTEVNKSQIRFNAFTNISYSIERNQFKLQLEESPLSDFKALKLSSLFDNKNNSTFLSNTKDDLYFAWQLSSFLSVSFNIFENQYSYSEQQAQSNPFNSNSIAFNKTINSFSPSSANRNVSGYKFGLSSELGLGNNYKLGLNFDIGQLEDADLIGFNQKEINTTSFALGIRKSQFGASINTDIFLEDMDANIEQSRLGFELDWHFSKDGKLSFGSKKTIGDSTSNSLKSIDDITGNVQYIKFQHNL